MGNLGSLLVVLRGRRVTSVTLLHILGVAQITESVLQSLLLDLLVSQLGQLASSLDIADVLAETLGEDDIDLLQTTTGSLGVEEVEHGDEEGVPGSEEQVGTPADRGNHDRGDHDNSEVEDPVGAGGDGVGLSTGADGRDLGWVQPGQRKDTGTEEGDVQEESENGTLGRTGAAGDQTTEDDNHGDQLAGHTTDKQLATTDLLDEEPGEGGEDSVDDHVDTGDNQGHGAVHAERVLHQHGQVVDDSVTARQLLGDLRGRTDQHTTEVLGATTSKQVAVASTLGNTSSFDGLDDQLLLQLSLGGVDLSTTKGSQNVLTLVDLTTGDEVAGRVGHVVHSDDDNNTEDDLEGNGETPGEVGGTVGGTEVDPVGDGCTNGNNTTLDTDEQATVAGAGALSLVSGNSGGVHAVTDTSDDTTEHELEQGNVSDESSDLNNDTNNHNSTTQHHHATTTNPVCGEQGEHGTEQTTSLVDGSNQSLHSRVSLGSSEYIVEVIGTNDTRHHTLIVTEQQETLGMTVRWNPQVDIDRERLVVPL